MAEQLAKAYEPKVTEQRAGEAWAAGNYFHAESQVTGKKAYTIVIPPPNVTAPLHLGHALNNTLQDILIRYHRMRGFNTLWMPGTDHAGIATQTVVEKRILAEEGKRRTDFAREQFVARVQAWKDEYEARIIGQLKAMGCSCDWERTRFTMDATCARAVRACFFSLFRDGLIYRGKRLVNWDPATQTVLADDEVEHETIKGHFWYMRYPLVETTEAEGAKVEYVTVATTRPETMLGDTAVAMNPADPRSKRLAGRMVRLPIVGRLIPIIVDEHVVMPNPNSEDEKARFSTGFLKVTPAHDPDDWEIGRRHNLPVINVMAPDASISDKHGWTDWEQIKNPDAENLIGMDRFEAREAIVEWFRQEGLLEDIREYSHEVGHSYRSHVPIEPYLSDQWYIAVKKPIPSLAEGVIEGTGVPLNSLAGLALKPLLDGRLHFIPERYARTYQTWLENLRDWPISRQLWWGHQIPVWHKRVELAEGKQSDHLLDTIGWERYVESVRKGRDIVDEVIRIVRVSDRRETDPLTDSLSPVTAATAGEYDIYVCLAKEHTDSGKVEPHVKMLEKAGFVRDGDVLDTWFSSALWPFSTLGWPQETPELKTFYPGDVLCTAREIITLWVSRMVMMGQYCIGDIPFSSVYIHAMIQDGEGRKMSKSLGNGIDPLAVINSHGADAMRFTLASMTTDTQDIRMPVVTMKLPDGRVENTSPKFDLGRNFCNKLWNASRFAMMNLEGMDAAAFDKQKITITDRWILSRLARVTAEVTEGMEGFRYNEPLNALYKFFWNDFCDWFLEWAKPRMQNDAERVIAQNVLAFVLDQSLRLLHPFIPFITEGIFERLNEIAPVRGLRGIAEPSRARALVAAEWPARIDALIDEDAERQISVVQWIIGAVRDIRTKYNKPPKEQLTISAKVQQQLVGIINRNSELIKQLAGAREFMFGIDAARPQQAAVAVGDAIEVYVHDVIDVEGERKRLEKQKEQIQKAKAGIEAKLGNENFLSRAKPEVVAQTRDKLAELVGQLQAVEKHLAELQG